MTSEIATGQDPLTTPAAPAAQARPSVVVRGMFLQVTALIYLQKFGVPLGGEQISLVLIVCLGTVLYTIGAAKISHAAVGVFMVLAGLALASQILSERFSLMSILFLLVTYALYVPKWVVSRDEYRAVLAHFSNAMLPITLFVFAQYLYQVVVGVGSNLVIDPYVPSEFLLQGYIGQSSTETWVTWNRPNGIVFLETSFASIFLACAIILEFTMLGRRPARLMLFALALVTTEGASGLALLVFALGWYIVTRPMLRYLALAGAAVLGLAYAAGVPLPAVPRIEEFSNPGSSAYGRILLPIMALFDLLGDPSALFTGRGAGTVNIGNTWPLVKLIYEYGLLFAVVFEVFFASRTIGRSLTPLTVGLFMVYQVTGGYLLSPIMVLLVYLLCAAMVVERDPSSPGSGAAA